MARDQIDMTPLTSRDELVAWLEAGVKRPSEFRIGTEHEKTPFTLSGHHPVPYAGARGIGALLEGMQLLLGWEPIMEAGNIIGLYDVTGGGAISLEPGGQFELSGAPVDAASVPAIVEIWRRAQITHAISIERCGRSADGAPRNMRGLDISTYTAPLDSAPLSFSFPFTPVAALDSYGAPTARVSPESATLAPNVSVTPVFDAFTYACWLQVVPLRWKV